MVKPGWLKVPLLWWWRSLPLRVVLTVFLASVLVLVEPPPYVVDVLEGPVQPAYAADQTSGDCDDARFDDLTISVDGHSVKRDGNPIQLTPLEFDLLLALARRPWQVFSREVLLEQVWGYRHAADTRLVNVHVQRLRSKIERDPEHPEIVVTVRGIGYKAGDAKVTS